ncbi:MAG TPA: hypothetical protein VKB45_01540 [Gemmatimonadales bacterium]|nr:hypothetical protein [Gemmatimonadales bacterium]
MRAHISVVVTFAVVLLFASRGAAQGPIVSFQAGATPIDQESSLFELGARFSPRGGFGGDVSIDLYPQAIAAEALAGVVDVSLAANLRVGPVFTLEPRVGASILGVVGAGGAVAAPGFSGGVGLVVRFDSRTALRVDYTYRRLMSGDELYTVPSLTAGFVIHP